MSPEQTQYTGPPLDVEIWIQRGNPESRLTGTSTTGNSVHFEITFDLYVEHHWIQEYAAGRREFRDLAIENARQYAASGKLAEAIIASRMALEIPWQGSRFLFNQGTVVRAMGMEDYVDVGKVKHLSFGAHRGMEKTLAHLDRMRKAMEEAFDTPYEIKKELKEIAAKSREAIKGREVQVWTEAVNDLGQKGELFSAGVGALELGAAYERIQQFDEALATYKACSEILKYHLNVVTLRENPTRHTAEVNELTNYLILALSSIVSLYSVKGIVKGEDKDAVKAAVYELDNLGAPAATIQKGYEFLASNTRFKEKRFYKKVARSR